MSHDHAGGTVDLDVSGQIGRRVTRNWLVAAVRVLLGQLVAALVIVVMSRELNKSDYAIFAMAALLVPLVFSVVATPVMQVLLRRPGALDRRSIHAAFTLEAVYVAACSILLAVGGLFVFEVPARLVIGGAGYLALLCLALPSGVVLQRNLRTDLSSVIEFTDRSAFQAVTLLAVLAGAPVATAVTWGLLAAGVVVVGLSQRFQRWRWRLARPSYIRDELKQARYPLAIVVAQLFTEGMMVPLLAVVASTTVAGVYGWSTSIASILGGFIIAGMTTLFPAFARLAPDALPAAVAVSSRLVTAFSVIVGAVTMSAMPALTNIVVPARWNVAMPTVALLIAAAVVQGTSSVAATSWTSTNSFRTIARLHLVCAFLVLACAVPGGAAFGAVGAATSLLVGRIVFSVTVLIRVGRMLDTLLAGFAGAALPVGAIAAYAGWRAGVGLGETWLAFVLPPGISFIAAALGLVLVTRGAILGDVRAGLRLVRAPKTAATQ